jgi:penicillin-binding protein 2
MSEPAIFFSEVNQRQGTFHRRAFLMGGLAGAGLLALGGRLAQLQLVEARRYQKLSAGNQFNYRLVSPPRGAIYDRDGVALASNRPNFRLLVTKDTGFDGRRPWTSWPSWSPSIRPAARACSRTWPTPRRRRRWR